MTKKAFAADASMLMVAIIWGATFPMVKGAVEHYPVFSFLALRFAIATVVLLLLTWRQLRRIPFKWLLFALATGLVNFAGFALQTHGLQTVAPGRTAFITGLYGALVPLILAAIGRGHISRSMWTAITLSVIGLSCLFWKDLSLNISGGDALVVLCAFAFAAQIVMVGLFPRELDPMPMATLQALACFGASALFAFTTEQPPAFLPLDTLGAALFTAIFATALALVVQTWAQRHTATSHAALIFCTEPVWGAFSGVVLFAETFTPLALLGCVLMLTSMVAPDLSGVFESIVHRRLPLPALYQRARMVVANPAKRTPAVQNDLMPASATEPVRS